MTSYRPETNENDLQLAKEQLSDADYERSLLQQAQDNQFWEPFIRNGIVEDGSAIQEWLIAYGQNHDMTDFYEEMVPFRHLLIQLLCQASINQQAMNADPSVNDQSTVNTGVDLALTIMDIIGTNTPQHLSIFREMAQLSYEAAKQDPEHSSQIQIVKDALSQERAKEDAIRTSIALSGVSTEFNLFGEVTTNARPFKLRDLSSYGIIYDNKVYLSQLSILSNPNSTSFQKRKSVRILAYLLAHDVHMHHPAHRHFFRYLVEEIPKSNGFSLVAQLEALRIILANNDLHFLFIKENGLFALTHVIKSESKQTQPLYLVGYSLWLLSYNPQNDVFFEQHSILDGLVNIIRSVTREKVLRIVLLVFVNMIERRKFKEVLIGSGLHKVLPVLMGRKWKDSDVDGDLSLVNEKLLSRLNELSSFEMYTAELDSGALKKSPVHTERFWRENAIKFDTHDPDYTYLVKLVDQLSSENPESVEVACYDLGEFSRFHPEGKQILNKLNAKSRLMALMNHNNTDISKAALLATQKLLIHKWDEIIQTQKASGFK